MPAKRTYGSTAVPLGQDTIATTEIRASCAVLLGHGSSSAKGARARSAVPLSRGINSAKGVRVLIVAPLNHGKGACASRAALPSHASRNEAAAMARQPPKRTCSPPPRPDHVVAVGLRCEKAISKTLLPDHAVTVGLRCGKAITKTPDRLRGSIQCSFATTAGALSFFPSRTSR